MIPLRDANPAQTAPLVTVTLIVINALVWFYEVSLGPHRIEPFIQTYGLVPAHFLSFTSHAGGFFGNAVMPLFTSIFLHGSWAHVIGNMWFLWIFGDNVEDRLGHGRFVLFYLLCGIGASLAHALFNPHSTMPTIGASGAISGVLGAYLIMFPHARVLTLLILFVYVQLIEIPAYVFLLVYIGFQLLMGITAPETYAEQASGVAYWAHIGGFALGVALCLIFPRTRRIVRRKESALWRD